MPVIERAGARLHYKVEGSGAPVLMVHSATSTGAHEWDALVRRLSPMYCCIVPDLRSHGVSDHVDGALGLNEVVSDLRALMTHIGRARPHIVGFSFGAEVALDMEIQQPGTAESLILVSPGTGHSEGLPQAKEMATRWPRSLRDLHSVKHGPEHWRVILEALADDAASRAQVADDVLSAIGCPMLLVVGSEDQPIRVAQARNLKSVNALAQLVTMDGAGHAAHAAYPEHFADVLVDFLAQVEIAERRRQE
jgi:pimeloyl-ACP methyl ester carboxylesterase